MKELEITDKNKRIVILTACLPVIYIIFCLLIETIGRMSDEISFVYTVDAVLYWTVGRGMLKGATPYVDLYENKPPGIFLLSALSFATTGNAIITNIICFICLAITGAAPIVGVIIHRKDSGRTISNMLLYASAILMGIMIMLFSQFKSGAAQVENIGAAFAIIYITIVSTIDGESTKLREPKIWLASLFLMFSVMMKEPFLLICIACALLFIETEKDMVKKLLLPGFVGGLAGILLQLATGTLIPYVKYYLPNMLGGHISRYGSPWERGLNLEIVLKTLSGFSPGLMIGIIFLAAIVFLSLIFNNMNETCASKRILNIIKPYLIFYITIFTVGLGGQYFPHHLVFAVPLYTSMFLYVTIYFYDVKLGKAEDLFKIDGVMFSICVACLIGVLFLPAHRYDKEKYVNNLAVMQKNADYVDNILDATGKSTYQFFGFNGNAFYCFTEHLPQGPLFALDSEAFTDISNWFSRTLVEQLDKVDIIVMEELNTGVMDDYVYNYITKNFTHEPPAEVENIIKPESFQYAVFYRT